MKPLVLRLNNHDWPTEIPGPDVTKEEFYDVLRRMPAVYEQAMADLRGDSGQGPTREGDQS